MIPNLEPSGHMPPGRYRCDLSQVQSRFRDHSEFTRSTTRRDIWDEWARATAALRWAVPVAAVWLGGSYISNTADPADLDTVYVVSSFELAAVQTDQQRNRVVALFAGGKLVHAQTGLRVDSYILPWKSNPRSSPQDGGDNMYLRRRGYWDDFWQRISSGPRSAVNPPPENARPRRGYLEVILDGFDS